MASPELIPEGVPLSSVPGLTAAQVKALGDSWILTAQEFIALSDANEALRKRLAQVLGVTDAVLADLVAAARKLLPATRDLRSLEMAQQAAQTRYGLGALLDEPVEVLEERLKIPPYAPEGRALLALPDRHDLLAQMPPIRNQGGRGTCVAHAALSVREQLERAAGAPAELNLSEQYVYWWCKNHDGIPKSGGTYIAVAMRCLSETGAPLESVWPYVGYSTGDEGQGPPPAAAANGDPAFCILRAQEFNRKDIQGIKLCLYQGRAVAFSIPVFDSWYSSSATSRWGKITLPLAGEPEDGGHAMTLVGYQDDADAPGGGYFLVRNSWQPWSWDGVWQEGYGYIPYAYLSRHATAVFSAYRQSGAELGLHDHPGELRPRTRAALTWNSPDIWLRRTADGGTDPQAPQAGRGNALYVRATNSGPACTYAVHVEIFFAPAAPYVPPQAWQRASSITVPWLKPGDTILGPIAWTPPGPGPYALLARLASADAPGSGGFDPAADNKIAQRNLWQVSGAANTAAEIAFEVAAAEGADGGGASLAVERGTLPAAAAVSPISFGPILAAPGNSEGRGLLEDITAGAVTGAIGLGIGQRRRASLAVTLPAGTPAGARHTFSVTQSQGTAVVGRLAVEIETLA